MFKEHIDNQIIRYPSLYFKTTYEKSEAMVLDQIFCVTGNGYEWFDGYPLCHSGCDSITEYKQIDIDKFFKMKRKIYMLKIENEKTSKYIEGMNIPVISEFSNERYIYTDDKEFAIRFNEKVKSDFKYYYNCDLFDRVRLFEKPSEILYRDMVSFYGIHYNYSMITEITKQKVIREETVRYGLKMLDYAERLYKGNFGYNSTRHMRKSSFVNAQEELEKVAKLRIELSKYA